MKPLFDLKRLPSGTPPSWAHAVNVAVVNLGTRKVESITLDGTPHIRYCCQWIRVFLQAHIRRGLSLLESGMREVRAKQPLATALCARALLEDAALVWGFNRELLPLLEAKNTNGVDALVFPKVFATRLPNMLEADGEEFRARNILTALDKMTLEHPNIRPVYDELSEVCHPNSLGVLWHFTDITDGKTAVFDDGQKMVDTALHHLIFCGLMFAAEEVAIAKVQAAIDNILQDQR
jgi:hypothetical protein